MKGFLSFLVSNGEVAVVSQSGIITGITKLDTGAFAIGLEIGDGSTAYQVQVSDDSYPVVFHIKNRASYGFNLILFGIFPGDNPPWPSPYNPESLCTVTIEKPEA